MNKDGEIRFSQLARTENDEIYMQGGVIVLFLELQKTRFDLRLCVLQGGGGQGGVGRQVGHGGWHLRDAAGELLPSQQGGRRGAVATGGGEVRHIHGWIVGHGNGGDGLQRGSLAGVLALAELRLRLHFQGGSEVEAEKQDGGSFTDILS